jgi:hypothetical protein
MWQMLRNERQNGAGCLESLISGVVSPSMSVWLSLRLIKNSVARATCKLASNPDGFGCPGMSFHTNAGLVDCDVKHTVRDRFARQRREGLPSDYWRSCEGWPRKRDERISASTARSR